MATMETYTMTREDLEQTVDTAKVVIVDSLVREGLLTHEAADAWCASHSIIFKKKTFFRTLSNLWKKQIPSEASYLLMVSIVKPPNESMDDISSDNKEEKDA